VRSKSPQEARCPGLQKEFQPGSVYTNKQLNRPGKQIIFLGFDKDDILVTHTGPYSLAKSLLNNRLMFNPSPGNINFAQE